MSELKSEQRGLRYIAGILFWIAFIKWGIPLISTFLHQPVAEMCGVELPAMSPVETVINIVDALVFYAGGMVIFAVTKGYKIVGSVVDGTWNWIEKKADNGVDNVDSKSEKIVDAINRIGAYVNDLLDRVEDLEVGIDMEEVDDE